jgi:hypothetical protein
MNKEIIEKFSDGIRVIMLCQRKKEGKKISKTDRASIREISTNKDEFLSIVKKLKKIKDKSNKPLRIYSCVNKRDIEKAIRTFKFLQLEADYYDNKSKYKFYLDIKNRFISALMRPENRAETLFLLDIDSEDEEKFAKKIIEENSIEIISEYKTKNGKHIITKPFNPKIMPGIEIKKDGMLLLDY